MYHNRLEDKLKGLSLFSAYFAFIAAFMIFGILFAWSKGEEIRTLLLVCWVAIGVVVVGLLIAKPYYVLLGLIIFTPFYPLIRRIVEYDTNSFGMIFGSWQDIFLGLLAASATVRVLKDKRKETISGLGLGSLSLGALVLWAIADMIGQGDWFSTLYGFRYTYFFMSLYFVVLLLPLNEKQIETLWRALKITILISALFAITLVSSDLIRGTKFTFDYQLYFTGKVDLMRGTGGRLVRFGSTFVLSHGAAPAYVLLALLGLSSYFLEGNQKGWIVFFVGLLAEITTMSRAGVGALLLSSLVFLLFLIPKSALFSKYSLPIFVALATTILGLLSYFSTYTWEYLLTTNSGDAVRQNQLLMAIDSSKDYPLGHGTGTAGSSVAIASTYLEREFTGDTNVGDSFYMKVLYELGYPGFILWTLSLVLMISSSWKRFCSSNSVRAKSFLAVSISYLIAIGVYSLTSNQLEIWPTKVYFWLLPALATLYAQIDGNSSSKIYKDYQMP